MGLRMRTTVDLDDHLFRELKQEAARRGTTLRVLLHEYIHRALLTKKRPAKYRFRWKTHRGRVMPGVQLNDRKSLLDLMDGR